MSAEVEKQNAEAPKPIPNKAKKLFLFSIAILFIFMVVFAFGFFQLLKVNFNLSKITDNLQVRTLHNETDLQAAKKTLNDLQTAQQQTQQVTQAQEKVITEWQSAQKGNLTKWQIAEAQYLINTANDNLQFNQNPGLALILLQKAQQLLQHVKQDDLLEIQKSLAADIAHLQSVSPIDITSLYLKLSVVAQQITQLPLPINPLSMPNKNQALTVNTSLPWWKAGLNYSLDALGKIVIVRKNSNAALPLVLPEEINFLQHNLQSQLEDAMWALLHRNMIIYQLSLGRSIQWIERYFDQQSPLTKNVLQQLQQLRNINIQLPNINFAQTLQLIDTYLSKSEEL
jgi:uroporphyrin-III C-methyltransferase